MSYVERGNGREGGSALVIVLIATMPLGMLGAAFMSMSQSAFSEERSLRQQLVSSYVSEAALREAAALIHTGGRPSFDVSLQSSTTILPAPGARPLAWRRMGRDEV